MWSKEGVLPVPWVAVEGAIGREGGGARLRPHPTATHSCITTDLLESVV